MSHLTVLPASKPGSHDDIRLDEPAVSARSADEKTAAIDSLPHVALANFYVTVKSCPLIMNSRFRPLCSPLPRHSALEADAVSAYP